MKISVSILPFLLGLSCPVYGQTETPPKPKPDYSAPADAPYVAEDVLVKTPAGHTLAGTLTLPKGASRPKPVGADRHRHRLRAAGPRREHRAARVSALPPDRRFARRGAASPCCAWTTAAPAHRGARSRARRAPTSPRTCAPALAYLRTRPEIRADRLGVLGHSEGAVIAPMVAEKEPTLRAIVLLAGVAQPGAKRAPLPDQEPIEHDTTLTPEKRDALIAADPARGSTP